MFNCCSADVNPEGSWSIFNDHRVQTTMATSLLDLESKLKPELFVNLHKTGSRAVHIKKKIYYCLLAFLIKPQYMENRLIRAYWTKWVPILNLWRHVRAPLSRLCCTICFFNGLVVTYTSLISTYALACWVACLYKWWCGYTECQTEQV